jgi:hypothetical protein
VLGAVVALVALVTPFLIWKLSGQSKVARAAVHLVPRQHAAIVPKPISKVSAPPGYPRDQRDNHCHAWWHDWFQTQLAAEDWEPTIEISAPANSAVTVDKATIQVFRSYEPQTLSMIRCVFSEGGPAAGTLLFVDLHQPAAGPKVIADDGSVTALAIPNAVININPGHTEYIAVRPKGKHRMYDWSVTLTLVVDQRRESRTFGSARHPLRSWLGDTPSAQYDYDVRANVWKLIRPAATGRLNR